MTVRTSAKGFLVLATLLSVMTVKAARFEMPAPGNDIVGSSFTVRASSGDSLESIGEEFGAGFHEMKEANPRVDPRNIHAGQSIIIPSVFILPKFREGIVINIAELRLFYFTEDHKYVLTYPVGLGRRDWRTPTAETSVIGKKVDPTWNVPKTIRDFVFEETGKVLADNIPPGPENPLGRHAIYLAKSGYLIHGTNQPWTIGKLISSGCIRMYNDDVSELFSHVRVGTKVHIVHHPYKVGWQNGVMYIEVHEPVAMDDPINHLNILDADQVIQEALKKRSADIDWYHVDYAVREMRGIPYAIGNFDTKKEKFSSNVNLDIYSSFN